MPGAFGNKMLPFVAVGRVRDGATLASYSSSDSEEASPSEAVDLEESQEKAVFKKLLAAAATKLSAGQRMRLVWNDGSVCCLMDTAGENLYCVVTALVTYPERLAHQLLFDLVVVVSKLPDLATANEHGLNDRLQGHMRDLLARYEDANNFPGIGASMSQEIFTTRSESSSRVLEAYDGSRTKRLLFVALAIAIIAAIGYFIYDQMSSSSIVVEEAEHFSPVVSLARRVSGARKELVMMV